MRNHFISIAAAGLAALLAAASARGAGPPPTPAHPVTNSYFGTKVVDDYIWLENFDDPAVKAWNAAENKVSRAYLDKLPGPRASREAFAATLLRDLGQLLRAAIPAGRTLCHEIQAARATALAGHVAIARRPGAPSRSCWTRTGLQCQGHDRHRLSRAFARRQTRGGVAVGERQRGRNAFHLRRRHRPGAARQNSARAISDRRRQRGLERRRHRRLLHALSARTANGRRKI